jgi:hypothetical protein
VRGNERSTPSDSTGTTAGTLHYRLTPPAPAFLERDRVTAFQRRAPQSLCGSRTSPGAEQIAQLFRSEDEEGERNKADEGQKKENEQSFTRERDYSYCYPTPHANDPQQAGWDVLFRSKFS